MAADQRLDLRLLRRVQQALLAWLAPAWLADQPFRPLGREAVADIEHPGWAQPNQIGNCLIGHPALAKPDDLPPALLLGRSRQLAHVHVPHARPIWSIPASTQDNEGRINKGVETCRAIAYFEDGTVEVEAAISAYPRQDVAGLGL